MEVLHPCLKDYVAFMTTPGTHNDTYAATAHRMFFANWVRLGRPARGPELHRLVHCIANRKGLENLRPIFGAHKMRQQHLNMISHCKTHQKGQLNLLTRCADNDGHNTDSVDGLINVLPLSAECALVSDADASRVRQGENQYISVLSSDFSFMHDIFQY